MVFIKRSQRCCQKLFGISRLWLFLVLLGCWRTRTWVSSRNACRKSKTTGFSTGWIWTRSGTRVSLHRFHAEGTRHFRSPAWSITNKIYGGNISLVRHEVRSVSRSCLAIVIGETEDVCIRLASIIQWQAAQCIVAFQQVVHARQVRPRFISDMHIDTRNVFCIFHRFFNRFL